MAATRGPRLQVGSAAWVAEERSGALQVAQSEVEEFSFSARNEMEWLNEHMAGIFDENAVNIAETFKTPGKLRGKTPRTARKGIASEARQPLSDVFTSTPNGASYRFAQHVNRILSPKPSKNISKTTASPARPRAFQVASEKPAAPGGPSQDSGYYGSQDVHSQETRVDNDMFAQSFADSSPQASTATTAPLKHNASHTASTESPQKTFQITKEDQTTRVLLGASTKSASSEHAEVATEHDDARDEMMADAPASIREHATQENVHDPPSAPALDFDERDFAESADGPSDEARSNSDGSSPIRPMVRKSSLNFASLPAREPLTGGKSLGGRTSRTSHLDINRKSYFDRQTGGKSLGNHARPGQDEDEDEDEDEEVEHEALDAQRLHHTSDDRANAALNHNRTYTQRLQDQINLLGKSKPSRPSKSLHNVAAVQQSAISSQPQETPKSPTSKPLEATKTTPGAFPTDEDDEDDWVEPPQPPAVAVETQSPRPALCKSYTADIMEGIHQSGRVSGSEFAAPSFDRLGQSASPQRTQPPSSGAYGHGKSASVATMPSMSRQLEEQSLPFTKSISVSNPALASVAETGRPQTPSKSPTRGFRDSPLKQVKNKLSSILKSSKGLLASSAAISAEGKTSMLSPSTTRFGQHAAASSESLVSKLKFDLKKTYPEGQTTSADGNKTLPVSRRTRASTEREKEEKRLEKEAKRMEHQEGKLEKAREKEREKARVFSKEQEKLVATEQQAPAKKADERIPVRETPKPTRSSPRKVQRAPESTAKLAAQDVDMTDAPTLAPPSVPRSTGPSQIARSKETTRPVKPTREPQVKPKQAPTVIRVKPGSQHSQYHSVSNGSSAAAAVETSAAPAPQPTPQVPSKASKATLQNKPSMQSLKAPPSASRPKALDLAAKKKEQDERDAQRRREAKADMEKKRAAAQEEQRKQEQRRQEAERQKQKDREQAAAKADARQSASRQALIEKAKQTRAPPPPVRSQPNGPPDYGRLVQDQADMNQPARPASRMDTAPSRAQDEANRPVKTVLSNASKAGVKRTIGNDAGEDRSKRAPSKGGPAYQSKDAKRRRTSQDHDELDNDHAPNIKGPPVRPSAGFMKELPKKSLYQGAYTQAPSGANLFKATVTSQHQGQMKAAHPMEMAKISKGAIPFAPNSNPAGPSSHKTPARPTAHTAKSTAKAHKQSPRFQNGESIELPEIETDDEDSDNDDARGPVAAWVDSPNLREALMSQETLDPSHIFGPPAPLNMEEVFNKSKERFHKFRARTSSANWNFDRLTEEDVRKDMAARDKIRRDGGWSYELSKDVR